MEPVARPAPELAGPAHALHALDQLGGDAEGDDHGRTQFVQCAGQDAQGALGIGQGVGGTETAEQAAETETVVERRKSSFEGHWSAKLDPGRPRGQGHVGQREQHVHITCVDVAPEDDPKDDPDGDDGQGQEEVVLEGPGPRSLAASVGHHKAQDGEDQDEQDRIRRPTDRRGETQRPDPPRDGMQRSWYPTVARDTPTTRAGGHSIQPASAPHDHDGPERQCGDQEATDHQR